MSLLCPIDFRYGRPKMKGIFEEESRLQRLLDVEAALARAEAKVGLIPEDAASEIAKKATTKRVSVKRVQEIEEATSHDLIAVVHALTEACEAEAGKAAGALGTGAKSGADAPDVQGAVMRDLGVGMDEAATRVVGRDRDDGVIAVLATLAEPLEKLCSEDRNLQRTEIGEVAEA